MRSGRFRGPLAVAGAIGLAGAVAWHRWVTPWHRRWGATDEEAGLPLPGDGFVEEPSGQVTRAITIDAEPGAVWPWVVQIGADRGGFYSYDWLENLFGLGIRSSDVVVPEWQQRAVGDLVLADARGTGGWYVMEVVPGEALALLVGDVRAGRPLRRDEGLRWEFLWTFAVRPAPGGRARLLVRERAGFGSRLTALLMSPVGFVSFVMTRRMLRGIQDRAEAATGDA
ncbi:SRPBCC family protein [Aquipuribacter sp. MA13-6]|uniref:SRPBCC family protein n=1 Tax=unclassified Aquipuribacter TaxID=2635084 RepID=UPI003EE8F773